MAVRLGTIPIISQQRDWVAGGNFCKVNLEYNFPLKEKQYSKLPLLTFSTIHADLGWVGQKKSKKVLT